MQDPSPTPSDNLDAPLTRIPSTGGKAPQKITWHTAHFTTHTGQTALSAWENPVEEPLPILYSYAIYFTHPALTIDSLDAAHMLRTLTADYGDNSVEYRLDMYLLPHASVDECIAHYRAEKVARGTYKDQVRNYESGGEPTGRLPGMVPSYVSLGGDPAHRYHGILYIYDAADWFVSGVEAEGGGRGRERVTRVSFDPEEGKGSVSRFVSRDPIVPLDSGVCETADGRMSIAERLWDIAPRQRIDQGIWCEAQEKGWTSW